MDDQQQTLGNSFGYQAFYVFIKIGGQRAAYWLLNCVCLVYVFFYPRVRQGCNPYLQRRFPLAVGFNKLFKQYQLVLMFGKVMVDRAIVAILGAERIKVDLRGRQQLLQVCEQTGKGKTENGQGAGMILLLSHVGCWQLAMSAMGALGKPIHMLMHGHADSFEKHAQTGNDGIAPPYRIIDPQGYLGGSLEMLAVLKQGGIVSIMGDRLPVDSKNCVKVPFMGKSAAFPVSAYHLASSTGAPIVVLTSRKCGVTSYEMVVADVIEIPAGLGRDVHKFTPYVRRYAQVLERYCQDNPYQFFNFFDMWQ